MNYNYARIKTEQAMAAIEELKEAFDPDENEELAGFVITADAALYDLFERLSQHVNPVFITRTADAILGTPATLYVDSEGNLIVEQEGNRVSFALEAVEDLRYAKKAAAELRKDRLEAEQMLEQDEMIAEGLPAEQEAYLDRLMTDPEFKKQEQEKELERMRLQAEENRRYEGDDDDDDIYQDKAFKGCHRP